LKIFKTFCMPKIPTAEKLKNVFLLTVQKRLKLKLQIFGVRWRVVVGKMELFSVTVYFIDIFCNHFKYSLTGKQFRFLLPIVLQLRL
jgi:hypothetical protein